MKNLPPRIGSTPASHILALAGTAHVIRVKTEKLVKLLPQSMSGLIVLTLQKHAVVIYDKTITVQGDKTSSETHQLTEMTPFECLPNLYSASWERNFGILPHMYMNESFWKTSSR